MLARARGGISAPKNSFVCARCVNLKVNAGLYLSKLDNSPSGVICVCVCAHCICSPLYKTLFYAHFGSNNTRRGARTEYMQLSAHRQHNTYPAAHTHDCRNSLSTIYTINLISLNGIAAAVEQQPFSLRNRSKRLTSTLLHRIICIASNHVWTHAAESEETVFRLPTTIIIHLIKGFDEFWQAIFKKYKLLRIFAMFANFELHNTLRQH